MRVVDWAATGIITACVGCTLFYTCALFRSVLRYCRQSERVEKLIAARLNVLLPNELIAWRIDAALLLRERQGDLRDLLWDYWQISLLPFAQQQRAYAEWRLLAAQHVRMQLVWRQRVLGLQVNLKRAQGLNL